MFVASRQALMMTFIFSTFLCPVVTAAGSIDSTSENSYGAKSESFDWIKWKRFNLSNKICRHKGGNIVCFDLPVSKSVNW